MNRKKGKKKRKLRLPQVIYILFLIGTGVFVSFRGGAFSYALFYAALLYPPLALLYLLFVRATFRIHQELVSRELKKRVDAYYQLTLENAGFLPASGIRLYAYHDRADYGEDMTGEEISLLPKETREYTTTIRCKFSGSYSIGIEKITFRDAFLLFTLTMKTPSPLNVQVLPTVSRDTDEEMARTVMQLTQGMSGSRMAEREDLLGNDLLPYMPGDPLKRIHWKNYARSGELYVRLPEEKDLQMISVVLLARPMTETTEELTRRDHFLDSAVTIATFFAEQKRPVQFFFYNAGMKKVLVENYEGMQDLCRELSRSLVLREDTEKADSVLTEEAKRHNCPSLIIREGEMALV